MTIKVKDVAASLGERKPRSAWDRGVLLYAYELLHDLATEAACRMRPVTVDMQTMLNGAETWKEYSYAAFSLIRDPEIARRLCCPSELRRCHFGYRNPRPGINWLDVQAHALEQAACLLIGITHCLALAEQNQDVYLAA